MVGYKMPAHLIFKLQKTEAENLFHILGAPPFEGDVGLVTVWPTSSTPQAKMSIYLQAFQEGEKKASAQIFIGRETWFDIKKEFFPSKEKIS